MTGDRGRAGRLLRVAFALLKVGVGEREAVDPTRAFGGSAAAHGACVGVARRTVESVSSLGAWRARARTYGPRDRVVDSSLAGKQPSPAAAAAPIDIAARRSLTLSPDNPPTLSPHTTSALNHPQSLGIAPSLLATRAKPHPPQTPKKDVEHFASNNDGRRSSSSHTQPHILNPTVNAAVYCAAGGSGRVVGFISRVDEIAIKARNRPEGAVTTPNEDASVDEQLALNAVDADSRESCCSVYRRRVRRAIAHPRVDEASAMRRWPTRCWLISCSQGTISSCLHGSEASKKELSGETFRVIGQHVDNGMGPVHDNSTFSSPAFANGLSLGPSHPEPLKELRPGARAGDEQRQKITEMVCCRPEDAESRDQPAKPSTVNKLAPSLHPRRSTTPPPRPRPRPRPWPARRSSLSLSPTSKSRLTSILLVPLPAPPARPRGRCPGRVALGSNVQRRHSQLLVRRQRVQAAHLQLRQPQPARRPQCVRRTHVPRLHGRRRHPVWTPSTSSWPADRTPNGATPPSTTNLTLVTHWYVANPPGGLNQSDVPMFLVFIYKPRDEQDTLCSLDIFWEGLARRLQTGYHVLSGCFTISLNTGLEQCGGCRDAQRDEQRTPAGLHHLPLLHKPCFIAVLPRLLVHLEAAYTVWGRLDMGPHSSGSTQRRWSESAPLPTRNGRHVMSTSPFQQLLHTNAVPSDSEMDAIRDFLVPKRAHLQELEAEFSRLRALLDVAEAFCNELQDLIRDQ
uniref:Uncharacterized protein n=1 Tax=Mycena chlorophos TaxID=658473 RepID=A0ABQ0KWU3_MYCCL|nr:predicted protein [Mycena chlorophos]